ncbi:MAG: hypothetical protein EB025_06595 [Chitinophagaceae bacterium]|nr:hypothetical protein [Chitinophagaceae bacterium]
MPNWVYNSLTIEGDPALIADVKRQLNRPFVHKHDNWNSETREMEVKDFTYSNPVFAFHNIYNHRQAGISDEDYIKQPNYSKSPLDFSGKRLRLLLHTVSILHGPHHCLLLQNYQSNIQLY